MVGFLEEDTKLDLNDKDEEVIQSGGCLYVQVLGSGLQGGMVDMVWGLPVCPGSGQWVTGCYGKNSVAVTHMCWYWVIDHMVVGTRVSCRCWCFNGDSVAYSTKYSFISVLTS